VKVDARGQASATSRATLALVALPLHDRAGLTPDQRRALEAVLASQHILQDVVRWRLVTSVVVQDEYTHDVVVPWDAGLYLVYDTT
jgi:hypothetical protein